MTYQKPKGTRDFYPEEKTARHELFDSFRRIATNYGYGEVETPAFETISLLNAKAGTDIKEEIFTLTKRGSEQLGLRFDLTVPAARLFIQKQKEMPKPVKWFYIDKMWRYERPQAGRLREFYQLGIEVFGSDSSLSDAEVLSLCIDYLRSLGLKTTQFIIKVNNRKLLEGLLQGLKIKNSDDVIRIIDKRKKVKEADFTAMLTDAKVTASQIKDIKKMLAMNDTKNIGKLKYLTTEAAEGLVELESLIESLKLFRKDRYVKIDLSTARGLAYYTGNVFECFDAKEAFRSIFAGGRYNNLIENFGGQPTPATGVAMGDATLQILLEENGLWPDKKQQLDYAIVVIGDNAKDQAFELCQLLRAQYSVDIDLSNRSPKQQTAYANNRNAKKVIFLGDDEIKTGKATVKDMQSGKESKILFEKL
jgi:histidyl-tRNA synthetase